MAVSLSFGFNRVTDANGLPYVGAKLYVYAAGTTTPASIFSDSALSVAKTNPLTSDATGSFDQYFIAAGTYKLRAETSGAVLIREEDNLDTGLSAGSGALPIASGGTGATTAAAARSNLDVPSNSELSAVSTTVTTLSTTVAALLLQPQGYLTATTGVPIITSDVTAGTAIYYTPYTGNTVPIYSGTAFVLTAFSELSLTLGVNQLASTIYDLFVINDSGTVRLVNGPAWNSSTAGSSSRGTGAGTTELERVNGILVNKNSITVRHSSGTVAINARVGTYVGSVFIDSSAGQITCHRTVGQSRKWSLFNAYNRQPIMLKISDSTASWTYAVATIRQSRADATNKATPFVGLQEVLVKARFVQNIQQAVTNADNGIGWGIDSTTVFSGTRSKNEANVAGITTQNSMVAVYDSVAGLLGISNYNLLEVASASGTITFLGGEDDMVGQVEWLG